MFHKITRTVILHTWWALLQCGRRRFI